jgi:hypothetical protein
MKACVIRLLGVTLSVLLLSSAYREPAAHTVMAEAAGHFLNALTPEQQAKTTFAFQDEERLNWHFIPRERKGVPLREMTPAQRHLAHALMAASLSQKGLIKADSIMSLEEVLRILENDSGERRNPEKYYFSIFGKPGEKTWGFRLEGHHISLNYTLHNGVVVASPNFFGANPAEVRTGPRKGLRVLAREEDIGRELLLALNPEQQKTAIVSPKAYPDILTEASRKAALSGQPTRPLPSHAHPRVLRLRASGRLHPPRHPPRRLLQPGRRQPPRQSAHRRQSPALGLRRRSRPPLVRRRTDPDPPRNRAEGLQLAAIENLDPAHWHDILIDGPRRAQHIENVKTILRHMGEAGIPVLGYNFSIAGVAGRVSGPWARGGALTVGMDGPVDDPIPLGTVWNMIVDPNAPPLPLPTATHDQLWDRLRRFLDDVLPTAEAAGVRLAAHPDDPPLPFVRQQPRLVYQPPCTSACSISPPPPTTPSNSASAPSPK